MNGRILILKYVSVLSLHLRSLTVQSIYWFVKAFLLVCTICMSYHISSMNTYITQFRQTHFIQFWLQWVTTAEMQMELWGYTCFVASFCFTAKIFHSHELKLLWPVSKFDMILRMFSTKTHTGKTCTKTSAYKAHLRFNLFYGKCWWYINLFKLHVNAIFTQNIYIIFFFLDYCILLQTLWMQDNYQMIHFCCFCARTHTKQKTPCRISDTTVKRLTAYTTNWMPLETEQWVP